MRFKKEYKFLSNFYPCKIIAWGIEFPTAEHVYVAAKTEDRVLRKVISMASTPGKAKRFGRELDLRDDWEQIKIQVMRGILRRKFADKKLMASLQLVREEIIEHNVWHDNFWGACICPECANKEKKSMLGKLLMEVRDDIIPEIA